jgi:hypothetical protein
LEYLSLLLSVGLITGAGKKVGGKAVGGAGKSKKPTQEKGKFLLTL